MCLYRDSHIHVDNRTNKIPEGVRVEKVLDMSVRFFVSILVIGILAFIGFGVARMLPMPITPQSLATCFSKSSVGSHGQKANEVCLTKTVEELLHIYSARFLMNYIVDPLTPETISASCHSIAHVIGTETLAHSSSLEDALSKCTQECREGCIHGAVSAEVEKELGYELVSSEDIAHRSLPDVMSIGKPYCSKSAALCHGIGHLLYMSSHSYNKSLRACDAIAGASAEACYQGVFMESNGADNSISFATSTRPADATTAYPCDRVNDRYRRACFLYLVSFQRASGVFEDGRNPSRIIEATCKNFDGQNRLWCFFGSGYMRGDKITAPITSTPDTCERFSDIDARSWCSAGLVFKFIVGADYSLALDYCHSMSDDQRKSACYRAAFQLIETLVPDKIYGAAFCDQTGYAAECGQEFKTYELVKDSVPKYFR